MSSPVAITSAAAGIEKYIDYSAATPCSPNVVFWYYCLLDQTHQSTPMSE